jgi:hypothetical protein
MADALPFFAAETGTYSTTGPTVALSGTAASLGAYPARTFAAADADTTTTFASTNTCTVVIVKDATNYKRYTGAVWTGAGTNTVSLAAATLEGSTGTLNNGDAVTVFASLPGVEPPQIVATQAVVEAGVETTIRSFSPLRIFQAIAAKVLAMLSPGYLYGLEVIWESATSVSIGPGAAVLESGSFVTVPTKITLSGLSSSATTKYCIYLVNSTTIEVSTTVPTTAWTGQARSKPGDSSRRYVGFFITDASGNIRKFTHSPLNGIYTYVYAPISVFRVMANFGSMTITSADVSGVTPVGTRLVGLSISNTSTVDTLYIGPDSSVDVTSTYFLPVGSTARTAMYCPVVAGSLYARYATYVNGAANLDLKAFELLR